MKKFIWIITICWMTLGGLLQAQDEVLSVRIIIKGMSCPFCVYGVEKRLKKISFIEALRTDYKQASVHIQRKKKTKLEMESLEKAIADAGFSVELIRLSIKGTPTDWDGKPALKEIETGQIFLLVESKKDHVDEWLSEPIWKKIQSLFEKEKRPILVTGRAHRHVDMPIAIAVENFRST